jgi:hypothetical protein
MDAYNLSGNRRWRSEAKRTLKAPQNIKQALQSVKSQTV